MDAAIERYYAGFPEEAISMLKPLALSGDADAQYLLGNILYSLSKDGAITDIEDPEKWYKMAADQDSAAATYALGAIYHNKWLKSRDKNDAANAIVYYQEAMGLGYTEAQQPLERIKSRSRVSSKTAASLVKAQEPKPAPIPEPKVQMPAVTLSSSASQKPPAPESSAPVRKPTAMQGEALDKPAVAASNPLEIVQTADEAVTVTATLEEVARQCQNYTATGFNIYAQTIEGALLSGKATVVAVKPDASASDRFLISLSSKLSGTGVFVDLQDVPKKIASGIEAGDKYAISGIVVNASVVGADCAVRVKYQ